MMLRCAPLCLALWLALAPLSHSQEISQDVVLRSVSGQEVTAIGVLEARPEGLVLLPQGQYEPIVVQWSKFDLEQMKNDQPNIYYSYLDAQRFQRSFLLKMGVYEDIVNFDESVQQLNHELTKPRYYPLPANVNYLIEEDADVIRWKTRDFDRYNKMMRDGRQQLEDFLRRIFPSESIIIDDQGNLHHKDRADSVDPNRGETSLGLIFTVLADTQRAPSRLGLRYLREVTTLQSDVNTQWDELNEKIPNLTFASGNLSHMKLPILLKESQSALKGVLNDSHLHQANQQKLSDFTSFVYSNTPKYR